MTDRIGVYRTGPNTDFYLEFDRVGQNYGGNFTTCHMYLRAVNRGNTTSQANDWGEQRGSVDGIWGTAIHSGQPFMPSGVGGGVTRWRDGPWSIDIGHDGNGYRGEVILRMVLNYTNNSNLHFTAGFNDFPRIPKVPQAPYNLSVNGSTFGTRSFGVNYTRGDNMGAGIEQDHAEWTRADTGALAWDDYGPNGYTNPYNITALLPGIQYRVRVRSRNSQGWGPFSGYVYGTTYPNISVKNSSNAWKDHVPYVRVNGAWQRAQPYSRVSGAWKHSV
jgi:hypothetical protein